MAEKQQQMLQNGQELQTSDVNRLGETSGLADDRVVADLLRLNLNLGAGVAKAILPYGWNNDITSTVQPTGGNDGTVLIAPFRADIGSRTTYAGGVTVDGLKAWRDIRSVVFSGGQDPTTVTPATNIVAFQLIAANASGQARWDLVYAIVTPDATALSVNRAVKTPGQSQVTNNPTVTVLGTKAAIGYLQGTPSASPALPATPADSASSFNIPLAYVLVPNGFNALWPVKPWMILPMGSPGASALSKAYGGANLTVTNEQTQSATALASWANTTNSTSSGRPGWILPPEHRGREDALVRIDVTTNGSTNGWSHVNGGLVDNSRDWRRRIFKSLIFAESGGTAHFAWDYGVNTTLVVPSWATNTSTDEAIAGKVVPRFGQSFVADAANLPGGGPPGGGYTVFFVSSTSLTQVGAGIGIYIDTNGVMRVYINGTSNACKLFAWVEACGPMPGY